MSKSSVFRYILAGVLGLVVAVVFTAVVNLVSPADMVVRTLVVASISAVFSAFLGYILGASRKK